MKDSDRRSILRHLTNEQYDDIRVASSYPCLRHSCWWRYWFNADSFEKAGKNFLIDFYNFFYHFSLNSDLTKIVNSMRINQNWY